MRILEPADQTNVGVLRVGVRAGFPEEGDAPTGSEHTGGVPGAGPPGDDQSFADAPGDQEYPDYDDGKPDAASGHDGGGEGAEGRFWIPRGVPVEVEVNVRGCVRNSVVRYCRLEGGSCWHAERIFTGKQNKILACWQNMLACRTF